MNLREMAEKRVDAKIKFQENLYKYLIVNTIIAIVCHIFLHSYWLLAFVVFFWGIGIFVKFLNAFVICGKFDTVSYREHKIQEEMEKIRE